MDLSKRYSGLRGSLPVRAFEVLLVQSTEPVWRRVVGASLTPTEIATRRMEIPRHKAELGAAAIRQGMERKDIELRYLGAAMVMKAVADANERPHDVVTQMAVTDVAASVPLGEVRDNPYVDPAIADSVADVLGGERDG